MSAQEGMFCWGFAKMAVVLLQKGVLIEQRCCFECVCVCGVTGRLLEAGDGQQSPRCH